MLFYQGFRAMQATFLCTPVTSNMRHATKVFLFFVACCLSLVVSSGAAPGFDHSRLGKLLKAHVEEGWVDYPGFARDREELDRYLQWVSAVKTTTLESWTREDQIAFYLNVYNAITIERILDHYPPDGTVFFKKMRSIRNIAGVWNEIKDRIAGQDLTLDDIEHEILRKRYQEPLIHFGLVSASRSCPPLRQEPFEGPILMKQLHQAAQEFLLDPSRGVLIDEEQKLVSLSKIFDWFGEDFIPRYGGGKPAERYGEKVGASLNFVSQYLPKEQKELIHRGGYRVDFLPYDWTLNEKTVPE